MGRLSLKDSMKQNLRGDGSFPTPLRECVRTSLQFFPGIPTGQASSRLSWRTTVPPLCRPCQSRPGLIAKTPSGPSCLNVIFKFRKSEVYLVPISPQVMKGFVPMAGLTICLALGFRQTSPISILLRVLHTPPIPTAALLA